jgi:hypothetical protein
MIMWSPNLTKPDLIYLWKLCIPWLFQQFELEYLLLSTKNMLDDIL